MPKYRKKPVVIEAFRVTDKEETIEIPGWLISAVTTGIIVLVEKDRDTFSVQSKEGKVTGKTGDWIIKGVEGELYICADSIFQKTYEAA